MEVCKIPIRDPFPKKNYSDPLIQNQLVFLRTSKKTIGKIVYHKKGKCTYKLELFLVE